MRLLSKLRCFCTLSSVALKEISFPSMQLNVVLKNESEIFISSTIHRAQTLTSDATSPKNRVGIEITTLVVTPLDQNNGAHHACPIIQNRNWTFLMRTYREKSPKRWKKYLFKIVEIVKAKNGSSFVFLHNSFFPWLNLLQRTRIVTWNLNLRGS